MNLTAPYLTPQERRRQKAMDRQLPYFRPALDERPTDADWLGHEPAPATATSPSHR